MADNLYSYVQMIAYFVRFVKRISLLVPGLFIAYVAVYNVFPVLDKYLPSDALSIVVTYIVMAYVLIPLFMRFLRILFRPKHIPLYTTTPDGFACDPINIGVVGTRRQLIQAMKSAGWYQADHRTPQTLLKAGLSLLFRKSYPSAPFSSLYLFGRSQDIGFQLPIDVTLSHRHHVRFWASTYTTDSRYRDHVFFWQKHHTSTTKDRILWVGAVSLDTGFGIIRHNAQITHMIDPDTNKERDFLAQELKRTGLVKQVRNIKIGDPYRLRNRVLTGYMHADGKMKICELQPA